MKLTDKQKQNAVDAAQDAMSQAYAKSSSLKWWERLIWILLAGLAAAASSISYTQDPGDPEPDTAIIQKGQ